VPHSRQQLGNKGEQLAAQYLQEHGFSIVETNYRFSRNAEIDIVAVDQGELVFVEVKTRHGGFAGFPEDAVTPDKFEKIKLAAQNYLLEHPQTGDNFRFDVIAVWFSSGNNPQIKHYKALA